MQIRLVKIIKPALKPFGFSALLGLSCISAQAQTIPSGLCVSGVPYTRAGDNSCEIPAGVTEMTLQVIGGGGGGGGGGALGRGGHGAKLTYKNLPVNPGAKLPLWVGAGGWAGTAGGGGGSSIALFGTAGPIIAGGGGGAGGGGRLTTRGGYAHGGNAGSFNGKLGAGGQGHANFGKDTPDGGGKGGFDGVGGAAGDDGAFRGQHSSPYSAKRVSSAGGDGGGYKIGLGGAGGVGKSETDGAGGLGGGRKTHIEGAGYGGGGGGGYGGGGGGFGSLDYSGGGGAGGSLGPRYTIYETASNGGKVGRAGGDGSILLTFDIKPPLLVSAFRKATVGQSFSHIPENTGGPIYACSAKALPPGLSIVSRTCEVTGRPTQPGRYTTEISASNTVGSARVPVVITIDPAAPSLSGTAPAGKVGTPYSFIPRNAGGQVDTCTASGLPDGLTINAKTCVLSGTPTKDGRYSTTLLAKNITGEHSLTASIQITLERPLLSGIAPTGIVGKAYRFTPTKKGGPIDSCMASGLPTGLSIDSRSCTVSGQPTKAGRYSFTITAKNASGNDILKADLTIRPAAPVLSGKAPAGQVGKAYSFTPNNAGGTLETCTATALPEGLEIDPRTCAVSGTPTQEGQYKSTITAKNAGGSHALSADVEIAAADQTGPVGPTDPDDPTNIPTLSEWGMIILCSVMALFGVGAVRRKHFS
jgi:hypothetical protein